MLAQAGGGGLFVLVGVLKLPVFGAVGVELKVQAVAVSKAGMGAFRLVGGDFGLSQHGWSFPRMYPCPERVTVYIPFCIRFQGAKR